MKVYYATRRTTTFNTATKAYVEHTYSFPTAREAKAWVKGEQKDGFTAIYNGTVYPTNK